MKANKSKKIIVGKKAGFCYGVRKAVNIAENLPGAAEQKNIYTIGPLIHNRHEVNRLSKLGIRPVSSIDSKKKGIFIIRTHGLPKNDMLRLAGKNATVVDATCPFVRRIQNLIEKLSQKKYSIIIVGEKNHPEIVGLVSYARGHLKVVESEREVKGLSLKYPIAVMSQTTQSEEKFAGIISAIRKKYKRVKTFNTICRATRERQREAAEIAKKVDMMLVIGGKHSGNTTRLKNICSKFVNTHHIESPEEIDGEWFKGINKIGVTAGASTPGWLIEKIKKHLAKTIETTDIHIYNS